MMRRLFATRRKSGETAMEPDQNVQEAGISEASETFSPARQLPKEGGMRDSATIREPMLGQETQSRSRDGIVVSTVLRLTTSDGERFEDAAKAMEHEAFYQILRRLVKELGWGDNEETATFALRLSQHFRNLLPLLNQLESDSEALQTHLKTLRHAMQD
jgi:hypothetical protein